MKIVLIVLDSFGIGEMPDAHLFGDKGSNTYLNTIKASPTTLTNMINIGLNNIDGINLQNSSTIGNYARLKELTIAKDTTAGHYEICGLILEKPYPTFPNGFPDELVQKIKNELDTEFLGNKVASGTEIIKELGHEHLLNHKPILYTSADSVLQIATHTDIYSLDELYKMCEQIRSICSPDSKYNIGRIIARPFATNSQGEFYRLENRKDYALTPPADTLLDKLYNKNLDTVCIGKIEDIFYHRGISESYHTTNNTDGIKEILKQSSRKNINGLIFANLNDTDSLYGHRNNPVGYAQALKEFDNCIPQLIEQLDQDDILMITADHGCDPTTISTDHSREYVPLLIYGKTLKNNINLGTIEGFNIISNSILDLFKVEEHNDSIFRKLRRDE